MDMKLACDHQGQCNLEPFPRTNIPSRFDSINDYKKLNDTLVSNGGISKNRHIWWKIRPHLEYKTLEFRVCDAQESLKTLEFYHL